METIQVDRQVNRGQLVKLAGTINREHDLVCHLHVDALKHAITCGEALIGAKEAVGWGGWLTWLSEHIEMTAQQARLYMRLARHKEEVAHLESLTQAERYLRDNAVTFTEHREEARRMRDRGTPVSEIARAFNVREATAYYWLSPKNRAAKARANQRRRLAAAAKREAERDRAMRSVDGDVSKVYVQVRKLAAMLDGARQSEGNRDAKRALSDALDHLYHVEDALVKAVRLSHPDLRRVLTAKRGD